MRTLVAVLTLCAVAAVAVACADDDDGATDAAAPPTTVADAAADEPGGERGDEPAGDEAGLGDPDGTDPLPPLPDEVALPIVFVHGFAGSAQQYESQAMRFVANGYPADRILAYDHDGAGTDIAGYAEGLAEVIADTLEEHDAEQVYLVGHSRGTMVSLVYLNDPDQAATVDRVVLIDGAPCPDEESLEVPCLAPTQANLPGQAHVEVATSAESFAMQYEFLVGDEPEVTEVVAQREPVVLSGRAVEFPANTGRAGVTLDIWAVDGDTGHRIDDEPHATFEVGPDGEWGPVEVHTGAPYEWVLSTDATEVQHHLYLQPYLRSSNLVRLLSSEPDGDTRTNTNTGPDHSALIVMRMREWYATDHSDADGARRDVLEVAVRQGDEGGDSGGDAVDVLGEFVGNGTIGLHLHDGADRDGETTLGPLPWFSEQPFQSGIDVYLPASDDGSGTITVTNLPRGDEDRPQVINVANWPSATHSISVLFADFAVQ